MLVYNLFPSLSHSQLIFLLAEVIVREIGGAVAPLWKSYVDCGTSKAILYVVDASAPEMIGSATIHLVELLADFKLESMPVLIVFSKTDKSASRALPELKVFGGNSLTC